MARGLRDRLRSCLVGLAASAGGVDFGICFGSALEGEGALELEAPPEPVAARKGPPAGAAPAETTLE